MQRAIPFLLLLSLLIILPERAGAVGALFGRQINSQTVFTPLEMRTIDASTRITDQVAVTYVDQVFYNFIGATIEATFVFPLPKGAFITHMAYWFNGRKYTAEIREREQAQRTYDSLVRRMIDPALLVDMGDNVFKLNVAPVHARTELRFEITYVELLPRGADGIDFSFLLRTSELSRSVPQRISVSVDALMSSPILGVTSPGHAGSETSVEYIDSQHVRVEYGEEGVTPSSDLLLRFRRQEFAEFHPRPIAYVPAPGDSLGPDAYVGIWAPLPLPSQSGAARDLVVVADVSSSMEGDRLADLKQTLNRFVDSLRPTDRFSIIAFSTGTIPLSEELLPATEEMKERARQFISSLLAAGLTNISAALLNGLGFSFDPARKGVVIFVTDGRPTWGLQESEAILDTVRKSNGAGVRLFTFGLGSSVDAELLERIAAENDGSYRQVDRTSEIGPAVDALLLEADRASITDVEIKLEGVQTYDSYVRAGDALRSGSDVLLFTRYGMGGDADLSLGARVDTQRIALRSHIELPCLPGGERAIALLWARQKIEYLLAEIARYGEREELVDGIVALSVRYGILTPYTALYADPNTSGVDRRPERLVPGRMVIAAITPNPMRERATIVLHLPAGEDVTLEIFDMQGKVVRHLRVPPGPGRVEISWDGSDDDGNRLAAGSYLLRLRAGSYESTRTILLAD